MIFYKSHLRSLKVCIDALKKVWVFQNSCSLLDNKNHKSYYMKDENLNLLLQLNNDRQREWKVKGRKGGGVETGRREANDAGKS